MAHTARTRIIASAVLALSIALTFTFRTQTGSSHATTSGEQPAVLPAIAFFPQDLSAHDQNSIAADHDPVAADYPIQVALPEADVYAKNDEQLNRAEWAIERFHLAGLDLPAELEIWFHGDRGNNPGCGGNRGTRASRGDLQIINVCSPTQFTLLHELGHAWAAIALTDSTRDAFADMRSGANSWADPGEKWAHKGTEHAADVMAWGLLEQPVRPRRTLPNDDQSLTDAYRFLTGDLPPRLTAQPDSDHDKYTPAQPSTGPERSEAGPADRPEIN